MLTGNVAQVQSTSQRICCLLLMISFFLVTGCGTKDTVKALQKQGVNIAYEDKNNKDKIIGVRFPKKADDKMVAVLSEPRFQNVLNLDLSNTQIKDATLEQVGKLTSLTRLNLNNTDITDAGIKHLTGLTNLENLDVGDTKITGEGLKLLQDVKSLKVVSLQGRPRIKQPKERTLLTAFRMGIDLGGGTNLVYQVEGTEEKPVNGDLMDQMVSAVKRRLDPAGTEEITVRVVGSDRIEVIIPRADPEVVKEKKHLMTRLGSLEFSLLANRRQHGAIIDLAQGPERDVKRGGKIVAGWRDVGVNPDGTPKKVDTGGQVVTRQSRFNKDSLEFLVVFSGEGDQVTGKEVARAYVKSDESGQPAIGFSFNSTGANRFARLTGENLPKTQEGFASRLAILLDNRIHSAPSIQATISSSGEITGKFTQDEAQELVNVINAGALVLEFKKNPNTGEPDPIKEHTTSPTLGRDVQEKGKNAILVAAVIVVVFMLGYYMFAGVVADICLVLNLVLVMGAMAFIDAAFTLPGLAGIVLTIGMAVDANVLIFERIREEQARGSSLRMAIQNGFSRAFTTIVDANLTTLITAVVLYMIGTDQVKGFAVTLFIGIVMSMFSALFVGRLIFDICERKRWLKTLKMNSVIGATHLDFVSKKSVAALVSLVVIVAGIGGVFARGADLWDIDFRGGTMVTFEFNESQDREKVRTILRESSKLKQSRVSDLRLASEEESEGKSHRYQVRVAELTSLELRQEIFNQFSKQKEGEFEMRHVKLAAFDASMIQPLEPPKKKTKTAKTDVKVPPTDIPSGYAGGHRVQLSFTDGGMTIGTFSSNLARHLGELTSATTKDGEASEAGVLYTKTADLFRVDGQQKSKIEPVQGEAQKFDSVLVTVKSEVNSAHLARALTNVKEEMDKLPTFLEIDTFDSSIAKDMRTSAVLAIIFSLIAIVAYIWFRFKQATFGIAAVVALVHDVLIVLGFVALAPFFGMDDYQLNLGMIAAFLTIVGYSLNDTIVVFDRIREVRGKNPAMTNDIVNTSLNQTLSRTILTSLTTFIVVAILFFAGGEGIHGFAFCLVLGVIVGTYSSIYVASPVLLWLMNRPKSTAGQATATMTSAKAGSAT